MNKEQYIAKCNEISKKMDSLFGESLIAEKEYIKSNSEFKIGDKVIVNGYDNYGVGFVVGIYADGDDGNIIYDMVKMKKDGSASKLKLHSWRGDEILPYHKLNTESK